MFLYVLFFYQGCCGSICGNVKKECTLSSTAFVYVSEWPWSDGDCSVLEMSHILIIGCQKAVLYVSSLGQIIAEYQ